MDRFCLGWLLLKAASLNRIDPCTFKCSMKKIAGSAYYEGVRILRWSLRQNFQ